MEPKHGLRDMVSRRVAYAGLGCMGKVSMGIDPVHGLQCMIIDHHEHGPLCMITMGMVSMGIVSTRRWSPVHGQGLHGHWPWHACGQRRQAWSAWARSPVDGHHEHGLH